MDKAGAPVAPHLRWREFALGHGEPGLEGLAVGGVSRRMPAERDLCDELAQLGLGLALFPMEGSGSNIDMVTDSIGRTVSFSYGTAGNLIWLLANQG